MSKALTQHQARRRQIAAQDKPRAGRPASVAIVGGERIVRRAIERLLRGWDFRVSGSCDEGEFTSVMAGAAAIDCDVVVLIAGGDITKCIHSISGHLASAASVIPMLVLGRSAGREQISQAIGIGAKGYVNLDADPEELAKAVRTVAQNKTYLSPDVGQPPAGEAAAAVEVGDGRRPYKAVLTGREIEIVKLLCDGLSAKEIGRRLHISTRTVETHRHNVYCKCDVASLPALMRFAIQEAIVSL